MWSSSILLANRTSYDPSIHKDGHPISHPAKRYQSVRPSNYQVSHTFIIRRAFITSIDTSNQPYSSNICIPRSSFQPSKHLRSHSSTKLSIQSVIHPSGINLSVHLTTKSAIHPFIPRAFITSIDTSNQPYSSNLSTHRPSFQPPKHLIIHSSTKLSIQSVIHPSGINLSIHLNNQPATHLFIQPKIFCLINHPSIRAISHPSI